jgi:hypothetical protein
MRADSNWWKKSMRMRNPSKLLEKSKSLELNPRIKKCSTKFYSGEDIVLFKKNYPYWNHNFFRCWPNFLGLLGIGQIPHYLSGLQFWLS